jgi:hypothetical protein
MTFVIDRKEEYAFQQKLFYDYYEGFLDLVKSVEARILEDGILREVEVPLRTKLRKCRHSVTAYGQALAVRFISLVTCWGELS